MTTVALFIASPSVESCGSTSLIHSTIAARTAQRCMRLGLPTGSRGWARIRGAGGAVELELELELGRVADGLFDLELPELGDEGIDDVFCFSGG